jgi:hypothetical protein
MKTFVFALMAAGFIGLLLTNPVAFFAMAGWFIVLGLIGHLLMSKKEDDRHSNKW